MQQIYFEDIPRWAELTAQHEGVSWRADLAHANKHDDGWYENEPAQTALSSQFRRSQNEAGRYRRLKKQAPSPEWERAPSS